MTLITMTLRDDFSLDVERKSSKPDLASAEFIQIRYTDVPGRFLAKYLFCEGANPYDHVRGGVGLDGSSVEGFADIEESDLLLVPDRSTLRFAPIGSYNVATVIADVYGGFGRGRLPK